MSDYRLQFELRDSLAEFSLEVELDTNARALGIFGSSGAGKTTILEALAGWRRGVRGTIRCGEELWLDSASSTNVPPAERRAGYVPQDGLLFPHWTVARNIDAGARASTNRELRARVLRTLELERLESRSIGALSGGERQRVALARALCADPKLLLLDEPLASLDLPLRRRILFDLARVREEFGTPLVVVSHDPTEMQALTDHVVLLERGRKIGEGPPAELFTGERLALRGFENVVHGVVRAHGEGTAEVELAPGVSIIVPRGDSSVNAPCVVGLRADEILISTGELGGISARNCIPAEVLEVIEKEGTVYLLAGLGEERAVRLSVSLTIASTRELDLKRGRRVDLVFKTQSCQLLAASRGI